MRPGRAVRAFVLACRSFGVWIVLTWTVTLEQLLFGAVLSLLVGLALASFGPVVAPWSVVRPRRVLALATLTGTTVRDVVRADIGLALRVWRPRLRPRSGMIVVPVASRTDGELAAVGLLTSLAADTQIVDLDRSRNVLQYHVIDVPSAGRRGTVAGPTDAGVRRVSRS